MSELEYHDAMIPCHHCGHKAPMVATIAGKPPRNTGGEEGADRIYFGLCTDCWARGPQAGSREEAVRLWNTRAEDVKEGRENMPGTINALLFPWHDAAETPRPCELCLVEIETREKIYYYALYWDAFIDGWRDEDGEEFSSCFAYKWLRYQYLDTSKGEVQP